MTTAIVYSSKHGVTKECVNQIKELITEDVVELNLSKGQKEFPENISKIIIGSPVYGGSILPEVKEFCLINESKILSKKIGLFITCMQEKNGEGYLRDLFPQEITFKAATAKVLGGGLIFSDMGFIEKNLVKMVIKSSRKKDPSQSKIDLVNDSISLDKVKIKNFVEEMCYEEDI